MDVVDGHFWYGRWLKSDYTTVRNDRMDHVDTNNDGELRTVCVK